jgi:hypothetical protein
MKRNFFITQAALVMALIGALFAACGSAPSSGKGVAASDEAEAAAAAAGEALTAQVSAAASAPEYKVGDTGPAGGIVFYDKGDNSGGWRYLEAAPAETDVTAIWMQRESDIFLGTTGQRAAGKGKSNTADILRFAGTKGGGSGWAAQVCDELSVGGFDDWFLPSLDELNYMYENLRRKGLGGFKADEYWSSTQGKWAQVCAVSFLDGEQINNAGAAYPRRVRAARQF